ncbi:hypothetical protein CK203_104027 [Vitis vinifera]|uniref:Uncharacterized protein n=1 Tax=Vitis vinifera TaxID=29760 RepID=A0A438FFS9_VITVI|nr:hypothetical protein CK203_104027 [Vitis vinifera]
MLHFPSIGHFSEHPHSVDDSSSCSSGPTRASTNPPFVDQTMPLEEPTTEETKAVEPSSPQHPPPTI